MRRIRDIALFTGSALVVGMLARAAEARAWFQTMPASVCQLAHSEDAPYWDGHANARITDGSTGVNVSLMCPVLEDDLHLKAGATLYVIVDENNGVYPTQFNACVDLDTGAGGTCNGTWFVPLAPGLQIGKVYPSQMPVWQSGYNYPYVYVSVGSRSSSDAAPARFKGLLLMK